MFSLVEESNTCINNLNMQPNFGKFYGSSFSLHALGLSEFVLKSEVWAPFFSALFLPFHIKFFNKLQFIYSEFPCFNS